MSKDKKDKEFVYCSLRHCPNIICLRHNINIPFDVLVKRDTFKPDKNWYCKDFVEEMDDGK